MGEHPSHFLVLIGLRPVSATSSDAMPPFLGERTPSIAPAASMCTIAALKRGQSRRGRVSYIQTGQAKLSLSRRVVAGLLSRALLRRFYASHGLSVH